MIIQLGLICAIDGRKTRKIAKNRKKKEKDKLVKS